MTSSELRADDVHSFHSMNNDGLNYISCLFEEVEPGADNTPLALDKYSYQPYWAIFLLHSS